MPKFCPSKVAEYPRDQDLYRLVARQAEATPERTAIIAADETFTYARLMRVAGTIAAQLETLGVQPGDVVGVCVERTANAVAALLGTLKTGAAYLPLDPAYPADRLRTMIEDSGAKLVIAHRSLQSLAETLPAHAIWLDQTTTQDCGGAVSGSCELDPREQAAYLIYTSGSTGKPKGVRVQHQAVVNFLYAMRDEPGITADDVMLAMTTLSFDISVLEIFLPLVTGARLVLVSRDVARDGRRLIETIEQQGVTIMQATPSTWRFVLEAGWNGGPGRLKMLSGGEPLPPDIVRPLLERGDELWNLYGPTETTVWSTAYQVTDPEAQILVGKPINNTRLLILNERDQPQGIDAEGELLIGGDGVTLGYHDRPELTAQRFVWVEGDRYYRTGDLARFTADGDVQCLGRLDSQVKLHGHRIELGEIEAALAAHPGVRRAAATVREDRPGDRRLVAYVVPAEGAELDRQQLLRFIAQSLPDYMLPGLLVELTELPYTPNGKLDRQALPQPSNQRPTLANPYVPAATDRESACVRIWQDVLGLDRVGVQDNFFDLGGNSILALQVVKRLDDELNLRLSAAAFFNQPTIHRLLAGEEPRVTPGMPQARASEFAIVGMAAKFPGARNVQEFWRNLCAGVESITRFSPDELDASLEPAMIRDADYVPARGILEDATCFDAAFFGIPPREAELIDPQQRLLLELAWATLEDAGCDPARYEGAVGIWAGAYQTTYYQKNLLTRPDVVDQVGEFQLGAYNEKDYLALRVAHRLNLRGPAVAINTACSTSLVAVIEACNNLALGRCDMALAGGVSVVFPQHSGHRYQAGSILTPDGHCRPFDQDASGTLFSDGAGLVAIKRLEDAIRDGDQVVAVIKGLGINNDGGDKASFTAPSIDGQAQAIAMAQAMANIPAESIGYIEAHGTATPIGDPIEVAALQQAFERSTPRKQFCLLGSVKSNIGHTVAAAGVAGLIKTALALRHAQIPPTLHQHQPSSQINFTDSPFLRFVTS